MDAVLLDTCVLLKSYLCDTLLSIAEVGTFRPLWSDHVLEEELRRNLVKAGAKPEAVEHRLGQMATYFPDARVTGYEQLIGSMTNHPKDRHVLAAAVAGRVDTLGGRPGSRAVRGSLTACRGETVAGGRLGALPVAHIGRAGRVGLVGLSGNR
jgi:hypothetical protein